MPSLQIYRKHIAILFGAALPTQGAPKPVQCRSNTKNKPKTKADATKVIKTLRRWKGAT